MRASRGSSPIARLLATVALLGLVWVGCVSDNDVVAPPESSTLKAGPPNDVLDASNPRVQAIMAVQDRHTDELMSVENVVGTATGIAPNGQLAIYVFTARPSEFDALPTELEGIPVIEEHTGPFRAMAVSHKTKQSPPIQLGTSGGWRYDLANGYCCGGTLGSLVKIGTTQYVLSNYHVLEADIVSGGNSRVAKTGDPVIQPGLIDVSCSAGSAQNVASLLVKKSLPNSNVDCAVAQVTSGMVRTDGAILEVGTLSASTVSASIGQAVKKSGRTTGLTRSSVTGLNATVSVQYENECAGGVAFTKTFTGQIVVKNTGSRFLNSGDSGSLMVQDVTTNPKAVGLLFAGSSTSAIANPIGQVLSFLGASMVGL
jgi:hypothetical protein